MVLWVSLNQIVLKNYKEEGMDRQMQDSSCLMNYRKQEEGDSRDEMLSKNLQWGEADVRSGRSPSQPT